MVGEIIPAFLERQVGDARDQNIEGLHHFLAREVCADAMVYPGAETDVCSRVLPGYIELVRPVVFAGIAIGWLGTKAINCPPEPGL